MYPYLSYKGYKGSIEIDLENNMLFGKVMAIRDTITYKANTLGNLKIEFELSVDDYLAYCEELDEEPNKSEEL